MRQIMLRFSDDEMELLETAFKLLPDVAGDVGWIMQLWSSPFLARLLLDEGKTTHKINALIGLGAAFAKALAARARDEKTFSTVTMTSTNVWPHMVLPGPKSHLQGMDLGEFLKTVAEG